MRTTLRGHRVRAPAKVEGNGGPQFDGLRLDWVLEPRRHDPHYRAHLIPEVNAAAQHRPVGTELPLPETVAQDDWVGVACRAGTILLREKAAPQRWAHSEHGKQLRGHDRAGDVE